MRQCWSSSRIGLYGDCYAVFIFLPYIYNFVFFTYELMVKLSVVLLWSGHLQAGKARGLESGGGSGSVLMVTVWADLPVPVCCSCIEAGFSL